MSKYLIKELHETYEFDTSEIVPQELWSVITPTTLLEAGFKTRHMVPLNSPNIEFGYVKEVSPQKLLYFKLLKVSEGFASKFSVVLKPNQLIITESEDEAQTVKNKMNKIVLDAWEEKKRLNYEIKTVDETRDKELYELRKFYNPGI